MRWHALAAVVLARLRAQRYAIVYSCAAAVAAALVQPRDDHLVAGPLLFCSLLGIVFALIQSPGRDPHLDLCEQSAPLFGRELARSKALVPCAAATFVTAVYCAAQFAAGFSAAPAAFAIALPAVIACTLTALSATIRSGTARLLYILFACSVAGIACALAAFADSIPGEVAFCALASLLALRQYGEALARYDPI